MNSARRVVVSVALGSALAVLARTVARLIVDDTSGGWFMYEPNGPDVAFPAADDSTLKVAVVWLVAIGIWAAVSWRLFAHHSDDG